MASQWHAGDNIRIPVPVTVDGTPQASTGPVRARFVADDGQGVSSAVSLSESESGADWANGVFVVNFPATLTDALIPGAYKVAVHLGDIDRTFKTNDYVYILESLFD